MKRIYKIAIIALALTTFFASCVKDLDTTPIDPDDQSPAVVFSNPTLIKQVLAKLYAGLATSGQQGAAGKPDISGIDEGFGEYTRGFWYHQELTTDEAVIGWNDQTIKDFHYQTWGSSDVFIAAMYYRIFFQISQCNEFLRESTTDKLAEYGLTNPADLTNIGYYRAEARFLRALSYYHALDMFGNVPFVTENDPVGKIFPQQINRADLFNYIQSELLDIEDELMAPRTNEYGRADQACAWTLLAKLYLNSEVYIGQNNYANCVNYCDKVINAGYTLMPDYQNLFLADNNLNNNEVIFPINFDGLQTRTWGGTTFIIHAAIGGSMDPAEFGVAGGWGGTRTTSALVDKFPVEGKAYWHSKKAPKNTKSYTLLYVPGSYQDPAWDPTNTFTVLASVSNDNNFEGYLNFTTANTEFKFCKDPNWDVNYGDDGGDGTLEQNGANIIAPEPGYYKINVDLNNMTYTLTKTYWGLIGDATAGGWDTDTDMSFDPVTNLWSVTVDLTAAKIKFRANDAWDLNYGDNAADGILEQNGADIQVGAAGKYVVSMKLGYPDYTYTIAPYVPPSYDHRAMFWTDGQSLDINDISMFTEGYAITKFKNVTSSGAPGLDGTYCDTDFPLMRLADVYLMYAEAVLRGGGGDAGTALNLVNEVRTRAYGGQTAGNISADQLTLDFIIDERARELYWEGYRRTDLIRFGMFSTSNYVWQWKGNVKDGRSMPSFLNIFPIPSSDLSANYNLKQNTGY